MGVQRWGTQDSSFDHTGMAVILTFFTLLVDVPGDALEILNQKGILFSNTNHIQTKYLIKLKRNPHVSLNKEWFIQIFIGKEHKTSVFKFNGIVGILAECPKSWSYHQLILSFIISFILQEIQILIAVVSITSSLNASKLPSLA